MHQNLGNYNCFGSAKIRLICVHPRSITEDGEMLPQFYYGNLKGNSQGMSTKAAQVINSASGQPTFQ